MHLFFELKVGFSNFQGIRLTVKHNVLMKGNEKPPLREKLSRGVGLERELVVVTCVSYLRR